MVIDVKILFKLKKHDPTLTEIMAKGMGDLISVVDFNDYFGSNFPTEHQNIDLGISSLSTVSALDEVAQQQRQKPVNRAQ